MPVVQALRPEEGQQFWARAPMCLQPVCSTVGLPAELAQDGAGRVHGRRGDRGVVRRPVLVVAWADLSRMRVPLATFRFEHDGPPGKSKGELFPTAAFQEGQACFFTNSASEAV